MAVRAKPNLARAERRMPIDLQVRDVLHLNLSEVLEYVNKLHATMNWLRGSIVLEVAENDPFRLAMETAFDDLDKIFYKEPIYEHLT
jgi:hypothetical protein